MKGKQVQFTAPATVEVNEFQLEAPKAEEIIVRSRRSLISAGTELISLKGKGKRVNYPSTPGYSNVGEVIEAGPDAGFKPGQTVIYMGGHATCSLLGSEWGLLDNTFEPPEGVTDEQACFAALGGVAMHAIRRATVELGESVVVFGLGLVGQLCLQCAKQAGARPVIGVDLAPKRLELAASLGADAVLEGDREDLTEIIQQHTGGSGAEILFETTGTPHTIEPMMKAAAGCGRLVIVGGVRNVTSLDLFTDFQVKELTLIGSRRIDVAPEGNRYDPWGIIRERKLFLGLVAEKRIDLAPLITHHFPLKDAPTAYELLLSSAPDVLGVIFDYE